MDVQDGLRSAGFGEVEAEVGRILELTPILMAAVVDDSGLGLFLNHTPGTQLETAPEATTNLGNNQLLHPTPTRLLAKSVGDHFLKSGQRLVGGLGENVLTICWVEVPCMLLLQEPPPSRTKSRANLSNFHRLLACPVGRRGRGRGTIIIPGHLQACPANAEVSKRNVL